MKMTEQKVYQALEEVHDPEIPVLSVLDLGMITGVEVLPEHVLIRMIPTFAGCPAVKFIQREIRETLESRLSVPVIVEIDRKIQWNSNRLTAAAKEKLRHFMIAPPEKFEGEWRPEMLTDIECPHCGSHETYLRSPFGSTLCRALHYCKECGHVFEQFKPLG